MADKGITIRDFREKLKSYKNAGAARKAIGRFGGWSDNMKSRARKAVDEHFGEAPTKAPKKTKRPLVTRSAKEAVRGRTAKRMEQPALPAGNGMPASFAGISLTPPPKMTPLTKAERLLQDNAVLVATLKQIHEISPTVSLGGALEKAVAVSNYALDILAKEIEVPVEKAKAVKGNSQKEATKVAAATSVPPVTNQPAPTSI